MSQGQNDAPSGISLADVARIVQGRLEGDPEVRIEDVAPLAEASSSDLGFLADGAYLRFLPDCDAGAILVSEELAGRLPDRAPSRVVTGNAHLALSRLLDHLHPPEPPRPGVHATAVLGSGVDLGQDVEIGPYAVLGESVHVGDGVRIGSHVSVGRGSKIGAGSVLHPHVVLYPRTVLGRRVVLHAGVKLGVDGFGYVPHEGEHKKIPQVGGCVVEDDVEIGANSCVDRGSIGRTRIGAGSKLDNLVHLGHNVDVGEGSLLAAQVGIAGSTRLGKGVQAGGQAGIVGHAEIGDGARIGGQSGVIGDIEPGATVFGTPARDLKEFMRGIGMALSHPDLGKRVGALEREVAAMRKSEG